MSELMSNIMQKFGNQIGKRDNVNFPEGFHIIDLSNKEYFKNMKKRIFKFFPDKEVYHFPQMLPNFDSYLTHPSSAKLDSEIDFSTVYFIDDPIKKIPELSDIIEDSEVYEYISKYYKENYNSSFGAYHVSVYRNFKTSKDETGYLKWHKDNFPIYIKKVIIYLDDILHEEDGPTQIMYDDGSIKSIFGKAGTAVFFDMNVNHRGAQIKDISKNNHRSVLYFSICPYDLDYVVPIQALGVDVIYPLDLNNTFSNSIAKQHAYPSKLSVFTSIDGLNIGGGNFQKENWMNFDIRYSNLKKGQFLFDLSKKIKFPLEDNSLSYVYTSHCLEHLQDDVVDYILHESYRILKPGGRILIKLPDFEGVVDAYRNKDYTFFANRWAIESLEELMSSHNIEINLKTYMLLIFASYRDFGSSSVYGDKSIGKFIGPPNITKEEVDYALDTMSIKDFSKFAVNKIPKFAHDVIHLNAFTPYELQKRMERKGFRYITHSRQTADQEEYADFKRELSEYQINHMDYLSLYVLCEKE